MRRLALLEEPHSDDRLYDFRLLPGPAERARQRWWFAFNQVAELPEQLLAGRGRHLVDYLCHRNLRNPDAIDEQSRAVYTRAYSRPESIRAATRRRLARAIAGTDHAVDQRSYIKRAVN
ncbi:hypothetical protein ACQPXH_32545 [Nocardia sp. CA-135953]|uniref:hypothetical protein n=1 Tax=Nocardia sp. CA-135953 TaxID=3239978 RepID=UPI003D98F0A1